MKKTSIQEMNRLSVQEFKKIAKIPLVLILDNIRSQHNIGAVFRTSDAFLVQKMYLCGITATPPNRDIHKTALGATESVDWEYRENAEELVKQLKSEGYKIVALEQAQNATVLEHSIIDKTALALILGNEVNGVQDTLMELVDECLEIPQYGTKHSLNVSVSAGIAIYELYKKMTIQAH
ncbi:tRNA/rRNA methyltransferase [Bacteroidia bacterium]|nr:tRNA/rRNA methyltransferase [Bacteroidia bacterium]